MSNKNTESSSQSPIERLLADARKKLVETGTRNRLVHVNRENTRANALNIIRERSDDVFNILKKRGRTMKFLATGKDPKKADENDAPLLEIIEDKTEKPFDKARYADNQLETKLGPDGLQKRLLRLFRDAKTAEDEQGVNILYLALGFLTWFESKDSAVKREAPIILLPVELVRNMRTSTYDIRVRDDDIVTNLPLQKRLREDFGIEFPEINEDAEEWSPSAYFDQISNIIDAKPDWSIDADGMQLGFFSFAKLLMLRDLDPDNWPNGGLIKSSLIEGLLYSGFPEEETYFEENTKLDEILSPADIIQVVDADASQTKVIEEVRSGRNLVVQGPPGTGKSQTITNIIAAAVHDGKSVLFVAEKMAALTVVHKRLKNVGLDTICLELHSRAANKKQVLAQLANTLSAGAAVPDRPAEPVKLKSLRDTLNSTTAILHKPEALSGEAPYAAIAQMARLKGQEVPAPTLAVGELTKLNIEQLVEIEDALDQYGELTKQAGPRMEHPFYGTGNLDLQPLEIERISVSSRKTSEQITQLLKVVETLAPTVGAIIENFEDIERVLDLLEILTQAPRDTISYLSVLKKSTNDARLKDSLAIAVEWQTLLSKNYDYNEVAWSVPVQQLRGPLANGEGSFFARLGPRYRGASRELATLLKDGIPKSASHRIQLLDRLIAGQAICKSYMDEEPFLKSALESLWQGERTSFTQIADAIDWLDQLSLFELPIPEDSLENFTRNPKLANEYADELKHSLDGTRAAITQLEQLLQLNPGETYRADNSDQASLATLENVYTGIAKNTGRYGEWCQLATTASKLQKANLSILLERIEKDGATIEESKNELRYARAEAIWNLAREREPQLQQIANINRHQTVEEFKSLERQRVEDVRTLINAQHLSQLPRGAVGEMAVIRGELGKKIRHKPIRKLISQAGSMIQKIKPVLLMSPISVAQFLPPGLLRFDILVIDEASQVRPEDALGAIARCDQIVVVGDQKQLPPTTFFDRMTGSSDDEDGGEDDPLGGAARATEMESILSLCEARAIPQRMLEWHYRSRDPSLIAVSNREFYNSNLVLPPSPLQNDADFGLRFVRVNGVYSSASKGDGTPGTNKIEAQAIVDVVAQHALDTPDLSLGIIAFSVRQRNMITEVLEFERRSNPVLDDFLREGRTEDVFVKNIENVQGDERDVILISVGYGPHEPAGRLPSMSFGPINSEGGERRLNVLFSRARVRCAVFASFDPGDIDLSRTQKNGPRVFKRFLEYAKTGQLDQALPTGQIADSPFEDDVADVIRSLGYTVDHQIGSAGFLIDLGVKHPDRAGQYMLAVECDGATYHSALWARERDRLRQDVLEHLGWRFHRIWSTDWFYRRAKETDRLREILQQVTDESRHGISVNGANKGSRLLSVEDEIDTTNNANKITFEIPDLPAVEAQPYRIADIKVAGITEPHETSSQKLLDIVRAIVSVEGPIHQEEVARRLASAFGKERAGRRINELTLKALKMALQKPVSTTDASKVIRKGLFWLTEQQADNIPVRNRADQNSTIQKAENIPPIEIDAAIEKIMETSGAAEVDEIIRATARLFGFERVGSGLRTVIAEQVKNLPDA